MTTASTPTTGAGARRTLIARLGNAALKPAVVLTFTLALGASSASAGLSNNGTSLNGITLNGTSLNGASLNGSSVGEAPIRSEEVKDVASVVVQTITLADGTRLVAAPAR